MPMGEPSSRVLLRIHEGSAKPVNSRTLAFLEKHELATPRAERDSSAVPRDWDLTQEGCLAARNLLAGRPAYLPDEFRAEREKLERSLSAAPPAPASVSGEVPTHIEAATWNLLYSADADGVLAYLEAASWDVVCLQEVGVVASNRLEEREDWSVVNGLALAWYEVRDRWKAPHGAAIVARNGWKLGGAQLDQDSTTPGRGVSAVAHRDGEAISVVSWHAPNAVPREGETKRQAVERKMSGYLALEAFLKGTGRPLILGMDANRWNLGTELELPESPEPTDPYYPQTLFFSSGAEHGLRDALLEYLAANPEAHEDLLRLRPLGPLEITHTRTNGPPDRFDYLMLSQELVVDEIRHDYEGACDAGSDHALITALLSGT